MRLADLPTHVLAHICAFADAAFVAEPFPGRPQLPTELLARLSQADPQLQPTITELQRDFDASVVQFQFEEHDATTSCDRLLARVATGNGSSIHIVRCLQLGLELTELRGRFEVVKARQRADAFDRLEIDWEAVFCACPRLVALDLSGLPLRSTHLPALLRACGRHCRRVKSVKLPDKEWYRGPVGMENEAVLQALYAAMEQWFRHTGGLHQLTVPHRTKHPHGSSSHQTLADEFLLTTAALCPKLEALDGWKVTLREMDGALRCSERLECSVAAWEQFCRSCPKLRELHWYVFPFVDVYFHTLAATPRPYLRKLTLATNANPLHVTSDDDHSMYYQRLGCAVSSVLGAIAACPGLEELSVLLQEELLDTRYEIPPTESLIGDDLLEVLANHCPRLQRVEILLADSCGTHRLAENHTNRAITDRGFAALAKLPELRVVRVNVGSHCGADGLFDLLANAPLIGPPREIELVIGSDRTSLLPESAGRWSEPAHALSAKATIQFHEVLLGLLELMLVHHKTLDGRRFELRLRNASSLFAANENDWHEQLQSVVLQLAVFVPRLRLHIVRQGGVAGASLCQSHHQPGSFTGIESNYAHRNLRSRWATMAWWCAAAATAAITYSSRRASV